MFCGTCGAALGADLRPNRAQGRGHRRLGLLAVGVLIAVAAGVAVIVVRSNGPAPGRGDVAFPSEVAGSVLTSLPLGTGRTPCDQGAGPSPRVCTAWRVTTTGDPLTAPPVIVDDKVILAAGGQVVALDVHTAEARWTTDVSSQVSHPAVVWGELVVVTTGEGEVYGLDGNSGDPVWHTSLNGLAHAAPAVGDGILVVPTTRGVAGLDADDGTHRWTTDVDGQPSAPAVIDGLAVFGDGNGTVWVVTAADGEVAWQSEQNGWHVAVGTPGPVVATAGFSGGLVGLNAHTGEQLWGTELEVFWSTPIVGAAGANFYVVVDGAVWHVDATTGTTGRLTRIDETMTPVVGPQGTVYVTVGGGHLRGIDAEGQVLWQDPSDLTTSAAAVTRDDERALIVAADLESGTAHALLGPLQPVEPEPTS